MPSKGGHINTARVVQSPRSAAVRLSWELISWLPRVGRQALSSGCRGRRCRGLAMQGRRHAAGGSKRPPAAGWMGKRGKCPASQATEGRASKMHIQTWAQEARRMHRM